MQQCTIESSDFIIQYEWYVRCVIFCKLSCSCSIVHYRIMLRETYCATSSEILVKMYFFEEDICISLWYTCLHDCLLVGMRH